MDWKYKHFQHERTFAAPRDVVFDAARKFMSESLGWNIQEAAEGFAAEGYSFYHAAIANFRFEPNGQETRVVVDLKVARAGGAGFMLFDVGGYYGIQIRKWLDGVQATIHQKLTGGENQPAVMPAPANKTTACMFNGCLAFIVLVFGLWVVVTFVCAVVGLITGTLYLWGRGGTLVVHGLPARIISAAILLFGAFVVWQVKRKRKTEGSKQ
jgi:hypothetical protein